MSYTVKQIFGGYSVTDAAGSVVSEFRGRGAKTNADAEAARLNGQAGGDETALGSVRGSPRGGRGRGGGA